MCWGSEMIRTMARRNYSEEIPPAGRRLVRVHSGAPLRGIAADLGNRAGDPGPLGRGAWIGQEDDRRRHHDQQPFRAGRREPRPDAGPGSGTESPKARIGRREAENAQLRSEKITLTTERQILRQVAKYFAGETSW